jgi:sulfopyruvate decarboxylase TPP-binding subunit
MPLVLVQCSGLGNSLNAIGSLVLPYGLGFPVVVSMRGTLGERNPSQMPLGRTTVAMLEALGVQAYSLRSSGRDAIATIVKGAIGVADGARVLAPILLEAELEPA